MPPFCTSTVPSPPSKFPPTQKLRFRLPLSRPTSHDVPCLASSRAYIAKRFLVIASSFLGRSPHTRSQTTPRNAVRHTEPKESLFVAGGIQLAPSRSQVPHGIQFSSPSSVTERRLAAIRFTCRRPARHPSPNEKESHRGFHFQRGDTSLHATAAGAVPEPDPERLGSRYFTTRPPWMTGAR
jgi:hypothetical protein